MKNVIEIDGHKAVVSVDPELGMIRGPKMHELAVIAAAAENKSLNDWVAEAIQAAAQ
jgi:predicted HicB family RNase H-like nuclease